MAKFTRREIFLIAPGVFAGILWTAEGMANSVERKKGPSSWSVGERLLIKTVEVTLGALKAFDSRVARANKIMADARPCTKEGPNEVITRDITGLRRWGKAATIAFGHTASCLRDAAGR